jgi:RHS repeat-associated protein
LSVVKYLAYATRLNTYKLNLTEQHIYGSPRLGVDRRNVDMIAASTPSDNATFAVKRGEKHYELSNHLGNVLATVSDKKIAVMSGANLSYYRADVVSYSDYYPFGAPMTERTAVVTPSDVRYGFNGKEMDNESFQGAYDFGARMYDARLGRWMSVDPLSSKYAYLSPYNFVGNMPLIAIDPDGKDIIILLDKQAANGAGHQAILIGSDEKGWTYISKDGAEKSGSAYGKSRFTIATFDTVDDFKNSMHNFDIVENHSEVGGGETKNPTYILDGNGNKIQRYEDAFYIPTIQFNGYSTDAESRDAAIKVARQNYLLTQSDCTDVVTAALEVGEDDRGEELVHGDSSIMVGADEIPRVKQKVIEYFNKGTDYDEGIVPSAQSKKL